MPSINALARELEPRGLTVVLVNMGEDRDTVVQIAAARRYTAPIALDPDGQATTGYGVRMTPTVFLIDRAGVFRGRAIGRRGWDEADGRALLRALLSENGALR